MKSDDRHLPGRARSLESICRPLGLPDPVDPLWPPLRRTARLDKSTNLADFVKGHHQPPVRIQWKIERPAAGTRNRLVVIFPEPLDYAMLQRVIDVTGSNDARIDGRVAIEAEERRWTFTPERPWAPGEHRLVVETMLEDLAGNSIERPFEVDLFRSFERSSEAVKIRIPFVIR